MYSKYIYCHVTSTDYKTPVNMLNNHVFVVSYLQEYMEPYVK